MKSNVFVILAMVLLSCSNEDLEVNIHHDLSGQWVEVIQKTDTLTFSTLDNLEVMNLARGKEIRQGHLLPNIGSGLYEYELKDDKILLYWMLSSHRTFNDYNFIKTGNQLTIENFYDSTLDASLTFEKLN